jgi:thiamine biosynthesis lipoprotein
MKKLLSALVTGLLLVLLVTRQGRRIEAGPRDRRELLMDTLVTIRWFPRQGVDGEAAVEAALARMRQVEALFSCYLESSPLARLNRRGSLPRAEAPPELASVLESVVAFGGRTRGLFDGGLGRILVLWGFGPGGVKQGPPPPEELAAALAAAGISGLTLGPEALSLRPGMALDLGGYAKGYAVDQATAMLAEAGLAALVQAGGSVAVTGPKPDGQPWRVGVRDPARAEGLLGVLELAEGAVATSGDYERCYLHQGVSIHHLMDPRTGAPARHRSQVTVRAARCAEADGWGVALFVARPGEAEELARQAGVSALMVDAAGAVTRLGDFRWEPER